MLKAMFATWPGRANAMTSEYTLKARIFPTILAVLPTILLSNAVFDCQVKDWLNASDYSALFGKGAVDLAVVYLLAQVNRLIGAEIFQRLVSSDETNFPTTRMMLPGNQYLSDSFRSAIAAKIKKTLGLELPVVVAPYDDRAARRLIVDAVRHMREKTRGHQLLLQHNIEYGFARNLIGACPLALLAACTNIYLYQYGLLPAWGYKASIFYANASMLLMLLSPWILERYGVRYARILFQAYLDSK